MTTQPDFFVSPAWNPDAATAVEHEVLPDGTPAKPRGTVVAVEAHQQIGIVMRVEGRNIWVDRGGLDTGLTLWACAPLPWGSTARAEHERRTQILQPRLHRIATLRVMATADVWSRCEVVDGVVPEMRAPVHLVRS